MSHRPFTVLIVGATGLRTTKPEQRGLDPNSSSAWQPRAAMVRRPAGIFGRDRR